MSNDYDRKDIPEPKESDLSGSINVPSYTFISLNGDSIEVPSYTLIPLSVEDDDEFDTPTRGKSGCLASLVFGAAATIVSSAGIYEYINYFLR